MICGLIMGSERSVFSGRGKTTPPAWCIGPRVVSMSSYCYT